MKIKTAICLMLMVSLTGCSKKEPPDPAGFTEIPTTAAVTDESEETADVSADNTAGHEQEEKPESVTDDIIGNESTLKAEPTDYITMTAEDVTSEKITIRLKNNIPQNLTWGSWYALEKNVDGVWYEVKIREEEGVAITWTMDLRQMPEGEDEVTFDIDLSWYYKPLTPGRYRIVKDFGYTEPVNDIPLKLYVACEFYI